MSREHDKASETEQEMRDRALQAQLRRAGMTGKTVADSAPACGVCDEPIPQERREAVPGVSTCIYCQSELERAMTAHARGY